MDKRTPPVIVLLLGTVLLLLAAYRSFLDPPVPAASDAEREQAIQAARAAYARYAASGADLSAGPCIAEEVTASWAADITHAPRIAADDRPENQCQSYRQGRIRHFVELDPDGKLIRAR
jgi:type II secretory pathway component PulM